MRVTDWLTYTDIDQLKQLNRFYQCECNDRSKNELICSLLQRMNRTSLMKEIIDTLSSAELRFLQLIVFDTSESYTMEELVAKGRGALSGEEGEPRSLIISAIKRGWLFRGYSHSTHNLYEIPSDTKERFINLFTEPYLKDQKPISPDFYRDEENLMVADLYTFLEYLQKDIVRMANDGGIYKNQQKILFQNLYVVEDSIVGKGPRFGFGRNYHLYPDRFSLIYDYTFYKGYISEEEEGIISLSELGREKLTKKDNDEGKNIYRFWIRLYRKPITHLPIVIRWIGLLALSEWVSLNTCYNAVSPWISSYYYESAETLFQRIIKMMLHLGVLKIGTENDHSYVKLTSMGNKWIHGISAFKEEAIEEGFIRNH